LQLNTEDIGRRIASVRALRGLTQAELSEKAGVAEATVQRAEKGRLAIVTIVKIRKALDTSMDYLLDGKGAP
jgi:transcriptional regulator with XRE-family HTH domain